MKTLTTLLIYVVFVACAYTLQYFTGIPASDIAVWLGVYAYAAVIAGAIND